jgi:hypothetical protein
LSPVVTDSRSWLESTGPAEGEEIEEAEEIVTDFLPIPPTYRVDVIEGGQLVRVELPRSAMLRFGLPMNVERAEARIKADVVVGNDGVARAIRFVQ